MCQSISSVSCRRYLLPHNSYLPIEYHEKIRDLLTWYADIFSAGDHDIGRTSLIKHKILTENIVPIKQPPRRVPIEKLQEVERLVQDLLQRGLIVPSKSPWASPVVLVDKKDGTQRFCVDYRRVNKETKKDAFPIPHIQDTLDSLAGAEYYSTLDLCSGYWQVELDPETADETAFAVRSGLYQWRVMPFGLCNAPATFSRLMETVFRGLNHEILLLYLDDVVVFGNSVDEEIARLQMVFDRLRAANLKLKPKKCELFKTSVQYLGHVVSKAGVETDPQKVQRVSDWTTPQTVRDVRSFVGLASYSTLR